MKEFAWLATALAYCLLLLSGTAQAQLATGTVDFDVDSLHDQNQVTITLSDNSTLVLLRDYVVDDGPGKYTWIGFVQDDVNGRAFITVNAPNAVGTIQTSTKLYELAITEAATDPVQEIDPQTLPPEAEPLLPPIFSHGFEDDVQPSSVESTTAACDDTPAGIDVMVLYSDDAARASDDIDAEIRNAIKMANDSFLYSNIKTGVPDGIELKLNLVHTQMLQIDENSGAGKEKQLIYLTAIGDGFLDNVHELRNQFHADLTLLILESKSDACGIAYMSDDIRLAFGIVARDCIKRHSFTHELGHLFGADHDMYAVINVDKKLINITKSNYGYSYLVSPFPWTTVMAYPSECNTAGFVYCPRLGFFSSPDYTHGGVPRGVEETDNRKQLIDGAGVRACYRDRPKLSVQKLNKANGSPTTGGLVESSAGSSISPAISCGAVCEGSVAAGSSVTLAAKDKDGWKFVRWAEGGVCAGSTSPLCGFTVNGDQLARPEFAELATFTLTVQRQGVDGLVRSTGSITPAIDCGLLCAGTALEGTQVHLTASDKRPWIFDHWEGPCTDTDSRTCTITMNSNQTARAVFTERLPIPLSSYSTSHSCYLELYQQTYSCDGVTYHGELSAVYYDGNPQTGGGIAKILADGQANAQPGQISIRSLFEGEATGQWASRGRQAIAAGSNTAVWVVSDTLPNGTPVTVRVSFDMTENSSMNVTLSEPPVVQWEATGQLRAYVAANGNPYSVFLGGSESVDIPVQTYVGSYFEMSTSLQVTFQEVLISRATLRQEFSASIHGPYLTATGGLDVQFITN